MAKMCRKCNTKYYDYDYPFKDYGTIDEYLQQKVYFQCTGTDRNGEPCDGREWDLLDI